MDGNTGVQRDIPELDKSEEEFVTKWQSTIKETKAHFDKDFGRMRKNMILARQGANDAWIEGDNYNVAIIPRYLNQAVASLYAKNPTPIAEKRKTLDFAVWDGKPETATAAMQTSQTAILSGQMPDPSSMAILQDIEEGRQYKNLIDKVGKTLEICFNYFANEQKPRLKPAMKSLVRRVETCGVGYLMLGFQRDYAKLSPDDSATLIDSRNRLGELQRRVQDQIDDVALPDSSEEYELQKLIENLEGEEFKILREGPVFMFPRVKEIIVDRDCRQLSGFIGAKWIAREFHKSREEIQKIYNVDIRSGSDRPDHADHDRKELTCIWEVYNKDLEQTFTIADGYKGFLRPCTAPDYWIEGFFPVFALTFNETETEDKLYPLSNVHHLTHVQAEYNRSRENRRLHREANKPFYVSKIPLEDADRKKIQNRVAHDILELKAAASDQPVNALIERFQPVPLDQALYETSTEMEDLYRIVGVQEASLGGVSGGTATESSIAESSRVTSLSSNIDDLDEFLSDVVVATGQLMLKELSKETVMEIAGKGAAWPDLNKEEIAKELILTVKAGSSGRPNKAAELANMERAMPYMLQLPGASQYAGAITKRYLDLLDIDFEDVQLESMPSITAINAQMGSQLNAGAGMANDPANQGLEGSNNAPSTVQNEQGGQPQYPAPTI